MRKSTVLFIIGVGFLLSGVFLAAPGRRGAVGVIAIFTGMGIIGTSLKDGE